MTLTTLQKTFLIGVLEPTAIVYGRRHALNEGFEVFLCSVKTTRCRLKTFFSLALESKFTALCNTIKNLQWGLENNQKRLRNFSLLIVSRILTFVKVKLS